MGRHARSLAGFCLLSTLFIAVGCGSSATPAPTATLPPTSAPVALGTIPPPASSTVSLATDVGGLNDRSLNQLSWQAMKAESRRLGMHIRTVQSPTELLYGSRLRELAGAKPALILAIGYTMSRAVYDVALQYPRQRFAMVDARPINASGRETSLPNVENILFKEEESGYLAGALAGLMAKNKIGAVKHNVIGYLGGKQIPGVNHYLAGYVAGARRVDPSVRVIGQYANTFVNPALGRRVGLRQIAGGADILFQVAAQTGNGYLSAAQRKHVYGIGSDIDESFLGPFIVTSAVKHVDVAVNRVITSTLEGHFHPGDARFGYQVGATGITRTPLAIPASVKTQFTAVQTQLRRGTIAPPLSVPAR